MREKKKYRKIKGILFACIVVIGIAVFIVSTDTKKYIADTNKTEIEENALELIDNIDEDNIIEDKGEESATEITKKEVSNTPKSEKNKKVVNNQTKSSIDLTSNTQETVNKQEQTQESITINKEEVVIESSNQDDNSSNETPKVVEETPKENTDLYNSITHGRWETDVNDDSSLCEAKGVRIANNELNAILDWNELHEEEQKQPIINYSRCYPVIKDGIKHWYLHFFTTKGEGMDTELKNKYS